jgi:hypothetical protein
MSGMFGAKRPFLGFDSARASFNGRQAIDQIAGWQVIDDTHDWKL